MVRLFIRESIDISNLNIQGTFTAAREALDFVMEILIEAAFLDVEMPDMTGLELAVKLREIRPGILIVFVSAHDYVRDSDKIGGDYYLDKP